MAKKKCTKCNHFTTYADEDILYEWSITGSPSIYSSTEFIYCKDCGERIVVKQNTYDNFDKLRATIKDHTKYKRSKNLELKEGE